MSSRLRTVGVEEEFFVVDPETWQASPQAPAVLKELRDRPGDGSGAEIEAELFRDQLETQTAPLDDLAGLGPAVVERRRAADEAVRARGLRLAATGTLATASRSVRVTDDARYLNMMQTYGDVGARGNICGLHVHVSVDSDEEGVRAIDAMAPWLPLVIALSANSPFIDGHDTGYATWRSRQWDGWPSAGPTEPFGDPATYRRVGEDLVASGAARDAQMLYFDARLAARYPTVEVRVADVPTDSADTVLVAAVVRALVESGTRGSLQVEAWRTEMLRAARWRAARYGMAGQLLDPVSRTPRPAADVWRDLRDRLRPALEETGDLELVDEGLVRVLRAPGSAQQRAAFERSGSHAAVVADVVERTLVSTHS